MSMIGTTCKLCIVEVFPEDEGKYECKAVSSGGEATTSCIVFVEGRLSPFGLMPMTTLHHTACIHFHSLYILSHLFQECVFSIKLFDILHIHVHHSVHPSHTVQPQNIFNFQMYVFLRYYPKLI